MTEESAQSKQDWNAVHEIERLVRQYVPGPFRWIARQTSGPDDWCIALGEGAACFTLDERARRMEDDFIRELAAQILGFPPDSPQDYARRWKEAQGKIAEHSAQAEYHAAQRDRWFQVAQDLSAKMRPEEASVLTESKPDV